MKRAMALYANASRPSSKLKLYAFAIWLQRNGIPIELPSLLEEKSGYIHSYALIKSGLVVPDFRGRTISFKYGKKKVKFSYGDPIFFRGACAIASYFLRSIPIPFELGDVVIDIGATTGDTAILAALKGVKKVYAYEPYPFPFMIMQKNIQLNNLQDQIIPFNEAIGARRRILHLDSNFKDSIGANLKSARGKTKIQQITLCEAVKRTGGKKFTIKCNVEGHEKDIFRDATANKKWLHNCVFARIAWHYPEYPSWLLKRMPNYLKAQVLEGKDFSGGKYLSIGDHPYMVILTRNVKNK
jgi:FkbM family methyltransferase